MAVYFTFSHFNPCLSLPVPDDSSIDKVSSVAKKQFETISSEIKQKIIKGTSLLNGALVVFNLDRLISNLTDLTAFVSILLNQVKLAWNRAVGENHHPLKMEKYSVYLSEVKRVVQLDLNVVEIELKDKRDGNEYQLFYKALYKAVAKLNETSDNPRLQRRQFILALRQAILDPEYQAFHEKPQNEAQKRCCEIVEALSEAVFKPRMETYLEKIINTFSNPQEYGDDFVSKIKDQNQSIKQADKGEVGKSALALAKQKFDGALGRKDMIGSENTPHLRNHLSFAKGLEVDYHRHACPVLANTDGEVLKNVIKGAIGNTDTKTSGAIAPEYEEMLIAKRKRGEGHLYVNHQRRKPGKIEDERPRVLELEKLQERHANEFVLTQSVEGDLFKRKGKYAEVSKFKDLQKALIDSFKDEDAYAENRLPQHLHQGYLDQQLAQRLTWMHDTFFDKKDGIQSLEEWQTFVELSYALMRMDLLVYLSENTDYKITAMADVCKDDLDRGGNEGFIQDGLAHLLAGSLNSENLEQMRIQLLGPPILVKKKEAIEKRVLPGLNACRFLLEFSDEKKGKIKESCPIQFKGLKVGLPVQT